MDDYIREAQLKIGVYLFLAAAAARLLYLCQYANAPFFWVPSLDALYHDLLAQAVAAGRSDHQVFFRAPLYYYFLGGVYRLFGHSFWAVRLIQALLGSGSCVLLFQLGQRLFRPVVALLAAGMMALYGPLVFFDGELLTPVLEVFLDLCFLLLAARAIESRSRGEWLAAGLALGPSAITRPNVLVVLPVALLWIRQRRSHEPARGDVLAAALFLAGAALAPALVTVRNYRAAGDPVFIASQGGINLFLGNRPEADGFTPSTPRRYRFAGPYEDSVALYGRRAAEEAMGRPLTASQSQAYWVRRVLQWWRHDPGSALKLTGKKFVLAWTHREIRNNHAYDFVRAEFAPCLWFFPFGFWFAGPLGLLGMGLTWRETSRAGERRSDRGDARSILAVASPPRPVSPSPRLGGPRFLALFVLVYGASFVPFFVADRYRLPVVPPLLLFSAEACVWVGERLRGREWKQLTPAGVALAAVALFVNVDWYRTVTPAAWALDYWSAGNAYQEMGHLPEAEAEHREALALDPQNPEIWTNLGVDQYGSGRVREAGESFRKAIALRPPSGSAYYDLAMCELQLRHPALARQHLEQAVRVDPEYARARTELARLATARNAPRSPGQGPVKL